MHYFFIQNHVRKKVKCFCCDNDDILRDFEIIKHFKLCDYWYCNKCMVENDDILCTLNRINDCNDFENKWIVQVYWNNEKQWKSAKIISIHIKNANNKQNGNKMDIEDEDDDEEEDDNDIDLDHNQITIIYLENEMEDTINIDDNDMILRFVTNTNQEKPCKILVCYKYIKHLNIKTNTTQKNKRN